MYCPTRKNDQFYFVKSELEIGSGVLVKSMLSPKWYGSTYAVNITQGKKLTPKNLPTYLKKIRTEKPHSVTDRIMPLSALEKDAIKKALLYYNGNMTKTSKALGIGRNTLYAKIKKNNIG